MRRLLPMLPVLVLAACSAEPPPPAIDAAAHRAEIEAWRGEREERLRRPDGWLSLVGLHWVEPGTHTVGSDADNAIRLAVGPARLGTLTLEGDHARFAPAEGAGIVVGGLPQAEEFTLVPDNLGEPTVVSFDAGEASFLLIRRSGRYALRVRDARANPRVGFAGIAHYAIDPAWRVQARFEAHPAGRTIAIANVTGSIDPMPNPGAVVFTVDGREHRLEALDEGTGELFLIFADRTNGRETYGAGRFLYAPWPEQGRTVLDFNRAYNPPCAFNAHSTCPLPPPENRLDLAVTAGEKKYTGPTE
ncbi:DUF1684 domain-containing protein [Rehaibacterium terrae]|jgi:uncharacterized protein (DUF1684 family)|uniref:DUF1684 domain-containing protein n=1 Tax=Rehaibacterium terrae TaxID=1341696 RepID=A0A7W8DFQ1_9GAMM|nr:DUF1684 domain-containing protein [Rehaibacterium terrae]MBB5016668.1 hypothetical protein [Rehaibacterium terrae]